MAEKAPESDQTDLERSEPHTDASSLSDTNPEDQELPELNQLGATISATDPDPATTDHAVKYPEGGSKAWMAVLGAVAVQFCTMGYLNAFGVYQQYYKAHMLSNYSASSIAWIGSVQIFLEFSVGSIGGPIFDNYGTIALAPASLLYVVSIVVTSFCHEYYQFFLGQAVLGGIAIGLMFSPSLSIVGHYFQRRRGVAMGIVVGGSSLGGVVFPVILNQLLNYKGLSFGWTVRVCALVCLVLLSLACFTMKPRLRPSKHKFDYSLMRRPVYILAVGGIWIMQWGMNVPFFYLPDWASSIGVSENLSPYMTSILNGASLFGRISIGMLADKVGRFNIFAIIGICCGMLLFCWAAVTTVPGVIVMSAFTGFFHGAIVSLLSACVAQITPHPKYIGTLMGYSMTIWAFSGLSGPPIAGAILSKSGGFKAVEFWGGAALLLGSVLLLAARFVANHELMVKF